VALSGDGRLALSGSGDRTVRVWDLTTGLCRATLPGHEHVVRSVALSGDGRLALSGSIDRTVRLWNLERQCCIALFPCDASVHAVALSRQLPWLACVGDRAGNVLLFRIEDGQPSCLPT
jgi:WD40 repeat protein